MRTPGEAERAAAYGGAGVDCEGRSAGDNRLGTGCEGGAVGTGGVGMKKEGEAGRDGVSTRLELRADEVS
jgi:hypothetical protein